jgi:hypothetical protein
MAGANKGPGQMRRQEPNECHLADEAGGGRGGQGRQEHSLAPGATDLTAEAAGRVFADGEQV